MDSRGASIEDLYTQAYDNRSQQQSHINNKTTHTGRTYDLKTAINALSQSPDGDQVVCAGREVLKILNIPPLQPADDQNGKWITEGVNLRAGSRINLNLSCNDVKWCPSYAKHLIATAATNGAIVIWDLNRATVQKQERIITEHSRAVNRVAFHPTEAAILQSASQDGTVKLWDLRTRNEAQLTFDGKAESVRDVQFSPVSQYEFAAAFENGTLQRWDLRAPKIYERKLNAHNGLALTIDWHPEGRYLASGGRDKVIKLWDMLSDSRKPFHYLQTIASVARVQWRPVCSGTASITSLPVVDHRPMALRKHFIASCSLLTDNRIHVWDIDRPHIPYYSFEDHSQVTTGFLWHDSNTIWSVSKDKFFFIHRLPTPVLKPQPDSAGGAYYPAAEEGDESGTGFRPAATMSMTAVDLNVWGDLVFCIPKVAAIKPANLPEIATTMAGAQQSQLATHHSTGNTSSVAAASGRSGLAARLDSLGNNLTWGGSSVPSNIVNFLSKAAAVDDNADLSFGTIAATSGGGGDFDEELSTRGSTMASYFGRKNPKRSSSNLLSLNAGGIGSGTGGSAAVVQVNAAAGRKKLPLIKLALFSPEWVQSGGIWDTTSFNYVAFTYLASQYSVGQTLDDRRIINDSADLLVEMCLQNFIAAQEVSSLQTAQTWRILAELCSLQSAETTGKLSPSLPFGNPQAFKQLAGELLEWYCNEGDVQMCVALILLLTNQALLPDTVDQQSATEWFFTYIELLRRFKLWTAAAAVIKASPYAAIRSMNQESTTVNTSCQRCYKPILNQVKGGFYYCDRCSRLLNSCSVCRLPVKSVYAWCSGCSHGGHLEHMQHWFSSNNECPTGCGHRCTNIKHVVAVGAGTLPGSNPALQTL